MESGGRFQLGLDLLEIMGRLGEIATTPPRTTASLDVPACTVFLFRLAPRDHPDQPVTPPG
jgi:hypothetical protein